MMKQLMYKEFKLSIHKFFFIVPILTGALLLIPQWVFLVAMMYFFWISIPNIYSTYNAQNDLTFCMLMPIKKEDYVKSKIYSVMFLEGLSILFGVVFAILNHLFYGTPNFVLDLNAAFFGVVFIMYGIFNLVFFPEYFKTGYRFGKATIYGNVVAILFALLVEVLVATVPTIQVWMESSNYLWFQIVFLFLGMVLFGVANLIAFIQSKKRFESIDL